MATYEINDMIKDKNLSIIHNKDSNDEHTITNKTGQNLFLVISLNAGAGDINTKDVNKNVNAEWWTGDTILWRTFHFLAGKQGTSINLLKDSKLLTTALGGLGSTTLQEATRQRLERSYWTDDSGNKTYRGWHSDTWTSTKAEQWKHQIARVGQQVFYPIILHNNESIDIKFIDNGARGEIFKGSVFIDFLYYITTSTQGNIDDKEPYPKPTN